MKKEYKKEVKKEAKKELVQKWVMLGVGMHLRYKEFFKAQCDCSGWVVRAFLHWSLVIGLMRRESRLLMWSIYYQGAQEGIAFLGCLVKGGSG